MPDTLTPVREALDAANMPLDIFVRDDDAGWDDARLIALLKAVARAGVAIDLAAIPLAVGAALARELCARIDDAPEQLGLHQHGYAHTNHQTEGRSCEFGSVRDAAAQRQDLIGGRDRLQQHFGHRLDALFTPPWNRCTPYTSLLLAELGYAALSRDRGAPSQRALAELPVDVDWCKQQRSGGPVAIATALARAIRERSADGQPLGLMLHHAQMDNDELALLERWFAALVCHPQVRWRTMRSLQSAETSALRRCA